MGLSYAAAGAVLILAAQAVSTVNFTLPVRHPGGRTVTICLAPNGQVMRGSATCSYDKRRQRLSDCRCPSGALVAETKICWPGEHAAPDSPAANRARLDAAENGHGNLVGARFEGQSLCQHVRDDGYPHWFSPVDGTPALRK